MTIMAVALGGALGSVLRYLLGGMVQRTVGMGFPIGTLTVNILGCLLVGVLGQTFMNVEPPSALRGLLVVGFCGGFTTFSTFSFETVGLFSGGEYVRAVSYAGLSTVMCVAATLAGMVAARTFGR
jgi:CrcB protein